MTISLNPPPRNDIQFDATEKGDLTRIKFLDYMKIVKVKQDLLLLGKIQNVEFYFNLLRKQIERAYINEKFIPLMFLMEETARNDEILSLLLEILNQLKR